MPKWAAELRDKQIALDGRTEAICKAMASTFDGTDRGPHLIGPGSLQSQINNLRERLGTSTPLIIWNIAVLIAIAIIAAKVWGYAPY